jgi:predicted nucleic acid-binding protein
LSNLVVDASAIADYLLGRRSWVAIGSQLRSADLHIPHICDLEFLSAIRRALLRSELDLRRAGEVLSDYARLPLSRHEHLPFARRIVELRNNFTAYDATYVALAEALDARLLTVDEPLISAVQSHTSVEAIEVAG